MYKIVSPPFTLKFATMSKADLVAYYDWFMKIKPERIEMLTQTVQGSAGYEDWKADYSSDSLLTLGRWYAENIEVRKRGFFEIMKMRSRLKFPVPIEKWELTDRTYSLALDIGMYFGDVFIHEHPQVKWVHMLKTRKDDINYGQPVLSGFDIERNPVRALVAIAQGLAKGNKGPSRLLEIYKKWEAALTG